jgi:hypothetical protein
VNKNPIPLPVLNSGISMPNSEKNSGTQLPT